MARTGTLFLVAVPIGNPDDITVRALNTLRAVDHILAENPHVTRQLLARHQIETSVLSYRPRTDADCDQTAIERLLAGENLALVADAGTPALVDPGQTLIAAAIRAEISVVPVPGATALIAALIASGLPTGRFVFEGSPPRARTDRHQFFHDLKAINQTLVLFESPAYLRSTLTTLADVLGADRRITVAFSITTPAEQWFRGTLAEAVIQFRKPQRGEYVLVIGREAEGEIISNLRGNQE